MENNEQLQTNNSPVVISDAEFIKKSIEVNAHVYDEQRDKLAKLKEQEGALVIKGVEDKKGYQLVKDKKNEAVKVRTSVDKLRKARNEAHNEIIKHNNSKAKEIMDAAEATEAKFQAQLDKVDNEIAVLKAKDKEAKETILREAGFNFDGSNWFAVDVIVSPAQIEIWPMNFVQDAADKGKEALKVQKEAKELQERIGKREFQIIGLGFIREGERYVYSYSLPTPDGLQGGSMQTDDNQIKTTTDDDWNIMINSFEGIIETHKAAAKKKADEEAAELEELRKFKEKKIAEELAALVAKRKQDFIDMGFEEHDGLLVIQGVWMCSVEEDLKVMTEGEYEQYTHRVLDAIEEAKAKALKERTVNRVSELLELGFKQDDSIPGIDAVMSITTHVNMDLPTPYATGLTVGFGQIESASDEDWALHLSEIKQEIERGKAITASQTGIPEVVEDKAKPEDFQGSGLPYEGVRTEEELPQTGDALRRTPEGLVLKRFEESEDTGKPTLIPTPNLAALEKICQQYMDFLDSEEYHEDNDYETYIYEAALEVMYGEKVWEFINKKMKGE